MEFRIWVETRLADRILERHNVATVERTASDVAPEEIGLSLDVGFPLPIENEAQRGISIP